MLTKKELRQKEVYLSRQQISERAIEIAELCKNGSYKNAVACIGRMVALSKTIEDEYWQGKFVHGAECEKYYLLSGLDKNHPDKSFQVN